MRSFTDFHEKLERVRLRHTLFERLFNGREGSGKAAFILGILEAREDHAVSIPWPDFRMSAKYKTMVNTLQIPALYFYDILLY